MLFPAFRKALATTTGQPGATGHLHDHRGDAFNAGGLEDGCEFFDILLDIVKLGTSQHHHFALQKGLVQRRKSHRHAIGYYQQIGAL